MSAMRRLSILLLAAALVGLAGCGGGSDKKQGPDPANEPSDAAAKPPAGYHTLTNKVAGFTIAIPNTWTGGSKTTTEIKSPDGLTVIRIAADRSEKGRRLAAKDFATAVVKLTKLTPTGAATVVKGSPYENASISASGKVAGQPVRQDVRTVVFRRPDRVVYGLLAFNNAEKKPHANDKTVARIISTFRAQAPDTTP
jgi:hypothetical protein